MSSPLNHYGDEFISAGRTHGADIALQRADDLDLAACDYVRQRQAMGYHPVILDMGAGRGAQAARMLAAGAERAVAVDLDDFSADFYSLCGPQASKAQFIASDFLAPGLGHRLSSISPDGFDAIICQRAIHYLQYSAALDTLRLLHSLCHKDSRLYLSASGLLSELGNGYAASQAPLAQRHAPLADEMAQKHGILSPVCLYTQEDLRDLAETAGFHVERLFSSTFGNIKAILFP